jgi:heptosyltransferase-2
VRYFQKKHDILAYLDLLNTISPANYKDTKLDLFTNTKDKKFAIDFWRKNKLKSRRVIVICPGGGQNVGQKLAKKIWPVKNFIELIKKIKNKYRVILIGGKTDVGIGNKIAENIKVLNLIGKTSLKESAEIMRKADLIISNDSGPMHMASAVNNKIISLFGPTDPRVLAPLNKEAKYIWKLKKPIYDIYGRITNKELNPITAIKTDDVLYCISNYEDNHSS